MLSREHIHYMHFDFRFSIVFERIIFNWDTFNEVLTERSMHQRSPWRGIGFPEILVPLGSGWLRRVFHSCAESTRSRFSRRHMIAASFDSRWRTRTILKGKCIHLPEAQSPLGQVSHPPGRCNKQIIPFGTNRFLLAAAANKSITRRESTRLHEWSGVECEEY